MLPEVWDCAVRVLAELVDGPWASISEAMLTQFLSKVSRRWPSRPYDLRVLQFCAGSRQDPAPTLLALSRLSSTIEKSKFTGEWDIEAYDGDGLTFNTSAYQDTLSMKFDGRDYEEKGPNVAPGSASSGKRVNSHTLEVTDKVKGEVMDHTKFEVSLDGKTLTLTIRETGQPKAQTIIYDKM